MKSRFNLLIITGTLLLSFPLIASATSYLPGQTLNPSCTPTDPTCVVVPNTTSSNFTATSSTATSTFAGNVTVSGNVSVGGLSGILRAVEGVITSTLVNLSSDVTGVLGIINGGTGISSAPGYGQVLVGNALGGYTLMSTSSLGIAGASSQWTIGGSNIYFNTGNIGIGTTSPSGLLTLDSSSATGTILRMSNTSVGGHVYDFLETGSANTGGAGRLDFFDNTVGAARLSIAANGNVGVGTTSPFTNFGVSGSGYFGGNLAAATLSVPGLTTLGNATTTNLEVTGGLSFTGNQVYSGSGTSSPANSFIFMKGSLSGVAAPAGDGIISPFHVFIPADTVNTNGNGSLIGFSIEEAASTGHAGARIASQSYLAVVGTPSTTPGSGGYVGEAALTRISANLDGTAGAYSNYKGSTFGANSDIYLTSGATFLGLVNAEEFDVTIPSGDSTADKFGISIVKGSNDAVRGTYDDSAISINDQDNANTQGWHYGLSFGSYAHQWAFATDSTLIMAQTRQTGASSPDVALNGIDFRNVTFGGLAFASPGFSVDPSGNIVGNDFYASSTNFMTFGGIGAGTRIIADGTSTNITSSPSATAFGYDALEYASSTSGNGSSAFGFEALLGSFSLGNTGNNTALGYKSLIVDSSGASNTGVGANTLLGNTTGSSNVALGQGALFANTSGNQNISIGQSSLVGNTSGSGNIAMGTGALRGLAGSSANDNIGIGTNTATTSTSGSNNIAIGYDIGLPNLTGSNQLDIGNLIFGTGVSGQGIAVSGNVGIGTSSPQATLEVWGPDTASTSAFTVANSASTTEFTVYDTGNAVLAGSLTQNSDQRLKTNISDLDGSSSLAEINALNPVTFNWIDPEKSSVPQFGFIAQQVENVFPNLVATTSPTALTPDGTLSLNYIDLISPIIAAIQQLDRDLTTLSSTVDGFAQSITSMVGNFGQVNTQELCVQGTCVTGAQLKALLASAHQSASSSGSSPGDPTDATDTSDSTNSPQSPVIQVNGANPATIEVGAIYNDLGATITGPQADLNLGIATYLNGVAMNPIQLDTTQTATDTIDYVVTDQSGLTSTSTRTVVIQAPITPVATASTTTATSSSATSTTP